MPDPNPNPNPNPSPAPLAGPDGSLAANWLQHEKIDAAIRGDKTLATIKDVPTMAAMLVNSQKLIGRKRLAIPEAPEDQVAYAEIYKALGVPEKVEGYPALASSVKLPEGLEADPEFAKTLTGWAHELHLTPDQLKGLYAKIEAMNVAQFNVEAGEKAAAQEKARADFRTRHGARADRDIQLAQTATAAFAKPEVLARLKAKGWFDDPDNLDLMAAVGEAVAPDRLHARSDGTPDAGSIQTQIDDLMASEAYRKSDHPQHKAIAAKVAQLFDQKTQAEARQRTRELGPQSLAM